MTNRMTDPNGWFQVKNNPLSKSGVFPYLGKDLQAEEPNKIYHVYRPDEELSDPECLDSFRLLPFVDEHTMLGSEDAGLTPAEQKGVHGVIGEDIYFKDGTLYANLKVFSDKMAQLIQDGKKELSCGYRCVYEMADGVFKGQPYQYIQRKIRGNHLALVEEGRMGPDVAVLDHKFTFTLDSKELPTMDPNQETQDQPEGGALSLESLAAKLDGVIAAVAKLTEAKAEATEMDDNPDNPNAKGSAIDEEADPAAEKKKDEDKAAMDSQIKTLASEIETLKANGIKSLMTEIKQRDQLATALSNHIGTFDHADKTLSEVAAYGVEKLGLKCAKGQEQAALTGFLHNRQAPTAAARVTMDSSNDATSEVAAFLNNGQ